MSRFVCTTGISTVNAVVASHFYSFAQWLIIHGLRQMNEQSITLMKTSYLFGCIKRTSSVPNCASCFCISRSNTNHLNQQLLTLREVDDRGWWANRMLAHYGMLMHWENTVTSLSLSQIAGSFVIPSYGDQHRIKGDNNTWVGMKNESCYWPIFT